MEAIVTFKFFSLEWAVWLSASYLFLMSHWWRWWSKNWVSVSVKDATASIPGVWSGNLKICFCSWSLNGLWANSWFVRTIDNGSFWVKRAKNETVSSSWRNVVFLLTGILGYYEDEFFLLLPLCVCVPAQPHFHIFVRQWGTTLFLPPFIRLLR